MTILIYTDHHQNADFVDRIRRPHREASAIDIEVLDLVCNGPNAPRLDSFMKFGRVLRQNGMANFSAN